MNQTKSNLLNRRKFIYGAGLGVAAFNILPGSLLRGADGLSANDKLNIAGIGIGGRGGNDVDEVAALGHNFVALCDVDESYSAKEAAKYPKARRFTDYRVMLDKMGAGVDALIIGTPDHTHAIIAMEAMRRGKHVYCEKPLTHTMHEVRALMAAAHQYKVITQLGNQGHSFDTIRRVCEWIWDGDIGKVHTIHAGTDAYPNGYSQIRNLPKLAEKHEVPKGLDYDLWVGPAEFHPYSPLWVPGSWRGWLWYGGGAIGDWICHVVDPAFWALDLGAPVSVQAEAPGYDVKTQGQTYPAGTKITFEFPAKQERGPVKLVWYDGNIRIPRPAEFTAEDKVPGTGAIIFGDKGMIVHGSHGAGNCQILPDSLMEQHSGKNAPAEKIPRVKSHAWDWADAIRNGRPAGSNFDYGGALTQLALLGLIALRFPGRTLNWDDQQVRFTNHEAANAFVNPPYRAGWNL